MFKVRMFLIALLVAACAPLTYKPYEDGGCYCGYVFTDFRGGDFFEVRYVAKPGGSWTSMRGFLLQAIEERCDDRFTAVNYQRRETISVERNYRFVSALATCETAVSPTGPRLGGLVDESDVAFVGTVIRKFGFKDVRERGTGLTHIATMHVIRLDEVLYGSVKTVRSHDLYVRLTYPGGTADGVTSQHSHSTPLRLSAGMQIIALGGLELGTPGDYRPRRGNFSLFEVFDSEGTQFARSLAGNRAEELAVKEGRELVAVPPVPVHEFIDRIVLMGDVLGKPFPETIEEPSDSRFPDLFPVSKGRSPNKSQQEERH